VDVKSKILSLELILSILQTAGPTFKHTHRFINKAFKRYLCPSIGINGISSLPRVFQLTLNVFLLLISNFKVYLKVSVLKSHHFTLFICHGFVTHLLLLGA